MLRKIKHQILLLKSISDWTNRSLFILRTFLAFLLYPWREKIFFLPIFCVSDYIIKNEDGIFYCKKKTDHFNIVAPDWEPEIRKYFNLKTGIFVDVGAHIGKYSVMVGRKLQAGKVIAIEADPENFEILRKNISLNNLKNVRAFNIAAYSKNTILPLYKKPHQTRLSTILPQKSRPWTKVKAVKLDTLLNKLNIKKIDLIKIDVEGSEREVLEGCIQTIRNSPKVKIIFEALNESALHETKSLLESNNFKVKKLSQLYYLAEHKEH
jgi:FkbM family methyltransferase